MLSSKREQAQFERRLVATLTTACETAKAEIPGFSWLTHTLDFAAFPSSLKVTWVFDTEADRQAAVGNGHDRRMLALTAEALAEADISIDSLASHVRFDSEQACTRSHAGDWQQRLAQTRAKRA